MHRIGSAPLRIHLQRWRHFLALQDMPGAASPSTATASHLVTGECSASLVPADSLGPPPRRQADDTCVMCLDCFNASPSHRDHEVFFYRTRAGGCCDCGDPEAWTSPCSCTIHGGKTAVHGRRPAAPADSSVSKTGGAAVPEPEDEGSPLPSSIVSSLASVGSAALFSVLRHASATRCRWRRHPAQNPPLGKPRLGLCRAEGPGCGARGTFREHWLAPSHQALLRTPHRRMHACGVCAT